MKFTAPLLIILSLIFSCKSAQKYYEQGNYEKATYAAADDLRKKGNNEQTRMMLENSYKKAVIQYDSIINHTPSRKKGQYLDAQFNAYSKLQQLSIAVKQVDSTNSNLQIKDYSADIARVANEAAAYRYEKGESLLQSGGKQNAQKAYHEFQMVEKYVPGYKDVAQKLEQASALAATNIVISTFDQRFGPYSLDGSLTEQNLLWQLNNIGSDKMNDFYTAMDAQSRQLRVDQFMNLAYYGFYFSPVSSDKYNYNVSKDIPSDDDKSIITVTATVYVTRRIINSRTTMSCTITDATNRILYTNVFPADYTWNSTTATYSGDKRALGPQDWALVNSSFINQPDRQFIYQQLMQQIMDNFIFAMRGLYS